MTHFEAQNTGTEEDWVTEHGGFLSDLFLVLFALGKIPCHIVKTLGQPRGDAHAAKNCGFLPTASKGLGPFAKSRVSEPSWDHISQLQSSLPEPEPPLSCSPKPGPQKF